MNLDVVILFPDDSLKSEQYFGPNIDVVSAMMAEILTENGKMLCRSIHSRFTHVEKGRADQQEA